MKFYRCRHCGNIITFIYDSGVKVVCCGEEMQEIIPATVEAAVEKHIPVVEVDGQNITVTVGSVLHPMIEAHYIQWIALETKNGNQLKELVFSDAPVAHFCMDKDDEVVAAYAYCNLHSLWKSK